MRLPLRSIDALARKAATQSPEPVHLDAKLREATAAPRAQLVVACAIRVKECPVQMEAGVTVVHALGSDKLRKIGGGVAAEVEILRVHAASDLTIKDCYIDPAKWSPLIYNFRHYYRLAETELGKTFRAEV